MSEKDVQALLYIYCEELGMKIHTETNKELFESKIPDAWYIDEKNGYVLIFECKRNKSQWKTEAKSQLGEYVSIAKERTNLEIIPLFVYGTDTIQVKVINDFNDKLINCKELKDFYSKKAITRNMQTEFDPHKFNQYIYDNFEDISINDKLKIIVSVMLHISQNGSLSPPLCLRCLDTERSYKMEEHFKFLTDEPYSKCVDKAFEFFKDISTESIPEILYSCFMEVSKWSFKGNEGARKKLTQDEGAVLTPPDIASLMTDELNIKANDIVCDPCCGVGNFLLEANRYNPRILIGNEYDITRYIITRHGMLILGRSVSKNNITCNNCMISDYAPEFDYLLMNPPYNRNHIEREFVLKFIKLSKKGGAVIIPSSNFRNNQFMREINKICHPVKLIQLNNKVFYPVIQSVLTSILIYSKESNNESMKQYDFTDDGSKCNRAKGRIIIEEKHPIPVKEPSPIRINNELQTYITKRIYKNLFDTLMNEVELNTCEETIATLKRRISGLPKIKINESNIRYVIFKDVFKWITLEKKTFDKDVPEYGVTQFSEMSKKTREGYEITERLFSINTTGDGGCGMCHVIEPCKCNMSSRLLFSLNDKEHINIDYDITAALISYHTHKILGYNRSKGVTKNRFIYERVPIYVLDSQ